MGGMEKRDIQIRVEGVGLPGEWVVPSAAFGVVLFAHGSGSSRLSPRNTAVARLLNQAGLATLLFDLLSPAESDDRGNVFDIPLLATRLLAATGWLRDGAGGNGTGTLHLPIGYFGASTGAAAALWAAAELRQGVAAVVSRGGRPDLAEPRLESVTAPTLLIVGGRDEQVLALNRRAQQQLRCPNRLEIVAGATHLFEEPGALEAVASLARDWFTTHLPAAAHHGP